MIPSVPTEKVTINTHISPEGPAVFLYPALATLQLSLTAYALVRFCRLTSEQQISRRRYILFLLLILSLSTTRFALYLRENQEYIVDSPGLWKYSVMISSPLETAISFGCTTALSLVGDAFLVWRATVVWSHKPILRWFPIILYACSFGISLASAVVQMGTLHAIIAESATATAQESRGWDDMTNNDPHCISRVQETYQFWRASDFIMSVAVSVVTTTLIIARLLLLQRRVKNLAGNSAALRSTLPYRQIIALLLESALPFTLVGVAGAIATAFIDPEGKRNKWAMDASPILLVLWTNALALGPQFIALRIICGTAWTANASQSSTRPISQSLLFADDPVASILATHSEDEWELTGHIMKNLDPWHGRRIIA
ncbi:hypothetical protein BKA70DRAFT_1307434 [Coprinopsis sp. MPI-PUGE-AT-0042]|nr:hypothetical protein BKA70DRAFT_1307434 [Coprinopsis sp. MPI-PUGE-AT-0042]